MSIPGNLMTTAMAVMPHTDVDQAKTVEKAFALTQQLSHNLQKEFHLT